MSYTYTFKRKTYKVPIEIFTPGVDRGSKQLLSHYRCARLCLYAGQNNEMYTTFFGGISGHWHDEENSELVKDPLQMGKTGVPIVDGMPFIDSVAQSER